MIICLRSGSRNLLGHGKCHAWLFTRSSSTAIDSFASSKKPVHPYVFRPPRSRAKRVPCPVPAEDRIQIAKWIPYLDRFLPEDLRGGTAVLPGSQPSAQAEECQAILQLLSQARSMRNFDLLSYMGCTLNRWQAVRALIGKLLENAQSMRSESPDRNILPSNFDWGSMGRSFDEITGRDFKPKPKIPIQSNSENSSLELYDNYSEEPAIGGRMGEAYLRVGTMEEIWQSLGCFVLEAADKAPDGAATIMHHIYSILAHLHHLDFLPDNVYKYAPDRQSERGFRPAAIGLLQTRIMGTLTNTILADAMRDLASSTGQESMPAPLQLSERQLDFGIWLEFVLWCCVEGGYNREAAWILQSSRNRSKEWRVASCSSLQKNGPIDPRQIDLQETWDQCGKFSSERSASKATVPFLGLGERTISDEVVLSIMDGLSDSSRTSVGLRGDSVFHIWERIGLLRKILNKNGLYVRSETLNYLIAKLLESGGLIAEARPQALALLLNVVPSLTTSKELDISLEYLVDAFNKGIILNRSAMVLGLYQYALDTFAASGHISGTIDILEKLVAAVDYDQVKTIREAIIESRYALKAHNVHKREWSPKNSIAEGTSTTPLASLQISSSSLNLLVTTLTDAKLFSLASWILNPLDSLDSLDPIVPPEIYNDEVLVPAVIRYSTATDAAKIVDVVLENAPHPLPRSFLHPLLDFRITKFQWSETLKLLLDLKYERMQWEPRNIATLAAAIIRLEQPHGHLLAFQSQDEQDKSLSRAKQILALFLKDKFNKRADFSEARDHTPTRLLYQFRRIFQSIESPSLLDVCNNLVPQPQGQANPPCYIPTDAFRTLLATVVDLHGSVAGLELFNKWCISPVQTEAQRVDKMGNRKLLYSWQANSIPRGTQPFFSDPWEASRTGKIVLPDITVVRTIALAALGELSADKAIPRNGTRDEVTSVLNWAMEMFFSLGLTSREVDRELDGYVTRLKR